MRDFKLLRTYTALLVLWRCTAGSELFAIGGTNGDGSVPGFYVPTVEMLAVKPDKWATLRATLASPRGGLSGVSFRGDIFAIGGFTQDGTVGTVEAFNGYSWSVAPSLLVPRRYTSAVVYPCPTRLTPHTPYSECIFVIGGASNSTSNDYLASVEVFDGAEWTLHHSPLQAPRMQHGAAVHQGKIFVAGGFSSFTSSALRSVEFYDGTQWSLLPDECSIPRYPPRGQVAIASFQGSLFVAGAIDSATGIVNAFKVNMSSLRCVWLQVPSFKVARMNARLSNFNGTLYVVGGSNPPGNSTWLAEVELLQSTAHGWVWVLGPHLNLGRTIEALIPHPGDTYSID